MALSQFNTLCCNNLKKQKTPTTAKEKKIPKTQTSPKKYLPVTNSNLSYIIQTYMNDFPYHG